MTYSYTKYLIFLGQKCTKCVHTEKYVKKCYTI